MEDAELYDPTETSVKGTHALFIVRGDPRQYNLPPKPEVPTVYLRDGVDIVCHRLRRCWWLEPCSRFLPRRGEDLAQAH